MIWAVVPAAGEGRRFGGAIPKQYLEISGKAILRWTLERLAAVRGLEGIVVALGADDRRWPGWREIDGVELRTTIGGANRVDSVLAGLRALPSSVSGDALVLVHDAARPCVAATDIERLLQDAPQGGFLAVGIRDTVKQCISDRVTTVARESLWRAQTPQCFPRGALSNALTAAIHAGKVPTDEAQAMEWMGWPMQLVAGCEHNIKITTEQDLKLARWLLESACG